MRFFGKSLLIISCAVFPARGAATQFYGVEIGKRFVQTSSAAPISPATQGFAGRAFAYASAPTTGSVKKPNAATAVNMATAGDHIEVLAVYDSAPAMNGAWAPGNYTVNISNAADGSKSAVMNLANDFYPAAPRVSNFDAAQSVASSQPFTIIWDSLGRTAQDFAYAQILRENGDVAYETAKIPGLAGALNGLSTSLVIPANVLAEGRSFTFNLTSWRGISKNTTAIPGAQGLTAYTARTSMPIRTRWNTQDVIAYGVEKRVNYEQDVGAPQLRANGFEMTAFANGAASDSIKAATLTAPGGAVRSFASSGSAWGFTQAFSSQPALETAFAQGNYFTAITTKNNGVRTNTLSLAGNAYPNAAVVVNIDEAQWVRAGMPFTLKWAIAGGVASNHVQLAIMDGANVVLSTPAVVGAAGSLNGAQTSFLIPPGALAAGKTYAGMLRVCWPVAINTAAYPNAPAIWSYATVNWFPIKTSDGTSVQPVFAAPLRADQQTKLAFTSQRGAQYDIRTADSSMQWTYFRTVVGTGTTTTVTLPADHGSARFYKIWTDK